MKFKNQKLIEEIEEFLYSGDDFMLDCYGGLCCEPDPYGLTYHLYTDDPPAYVGPIFTVVEDHIMAPIDHDVCWRCSEDEENNRWNMSYDQVLPVRYIRRFRPDGSIYMEEVLFDPDFAAKVSHP